jgi:LysM repeat protein
MEFFSNIKRFAADKINQVGNEGLIPLPSVNNTGYSALGYLKSLAGNLGKPFAIQSNPETDKFLQNTVNASTKSDGKVTFNQNIQDKNAYNTLGSNIANKAFGRYQGKVNKAGDVIVKDDYDTNRSVDWHKNRALSGKDKEGNNLGLSDRGISAISAVHKFMDNRGLTNARPYGTEVNIGNVNPKSTVPLSAPSPVINQPQYTVKSGDTLTEIANNMGVSVGELAKRNNIANANLINVGQTIV